MLLKPSYTTQESGKVRNSMISTSRIVRKFFFQFEEEDDGGVLVGNHIEPRKVII